MNDESPRKGARVNLATRSSQSVTRGSDFARRLRRHRAVCRELDRLLEDVYGRKPRYPQDVT
jgi:hypothetical protein